MDEKIIDAFMSAAGQSLARQRFVISCDNTKPRYTAIFGFGGARVLDKDFRLLLMECASLAETIQKNKKTGLAPYAIVALPGHRPGQRSV